MSIGLFLLVTFHIALRVRCSEVGTSILKKTRNQAKEIGGPTFVQSTVVTVDRVI